MSSELFVGNLPYSATEESLNQYFSTSGGVESVKIITDIHTGRSRGFGFVKMQSEQAAKKAIEDLDGKDYSGRALKVNAAGGGERRPGGPRPAGNGGGGGGGFRSRDGNNTSGGAPRGERRPPRSW